jgi:hypothetical protein
MFGEPIVSTDATKMAENVVSFLASAGHNEYIKCSKELAEFFDEYLWQGNWDVTKEFAKPLKSLRFIQEDEFDQHWTSSMPNFKEHVTLVNSYYVFFVK